MCRCRWLRAVSSRVHWPVESIGQSESKGESLADITAFGSVVLSTHQTRHSILLERNLPLKASSNSVRMHHLCSLKKATCCNSVTCQSLKGSLNPIKNTPCLKALLAESQPCECCTADCHKHRVRHEMHASPVLDLLGRT